MTDVNWLGKVIDLYGPVATMLLVLLILVLFFFRRDLLMKQMFSQEERDRMAAIVDRNAQANDRLADAVSRLNEVTRSSAEQYTRQIEQIVGLVRVHQELTEHMKPKRRVARTTRTSAR